MTIKGYRMTRKDYLAEARFLKNQALAVLIEAYLALDAGSDDVTWPNDRYSDLAARLDAAYGVLNQGRSLGAAARKYTARKYTAKACQAVNRKAVKKLKGRKFTGKVGHRS